MIYRGIHLSRFCCDPLYRGASCDPTWPFYSTSSGVLKDLKDGHLCWKLEEPKGPKGPDFRTLGKTSTFVRFDI